MKVLVEVERWIGAPSRRFRMGTLRTPPPTPKVPEIQPAAPEPISAIEEAEKHENGVFGHEACRDAADNRAHNCRQLQGETDPNQRKPPLHITSA
jgi:hypothetical protein